MVTTSKENVVPSHLFAYNPVGTSSRARNNTQNVASSPPRDLDVKEPSEEEDALDYTDRMAGSDLVSIRLSI